MIYFTNKIQIVKRGMVSGPFETRTGERDMAGVPFEAGAPSG